jgi:hypothetical protein
LSCLSVLLYELRNELKEEGKGMDEEGRREARKAREALAHFFFLGPFLS